MFLGLFGLVLIDRSNFKSWQPQIQYFSEVKSGLCHDHGHRDIAMTIVTLIFVMFSVLIICSLVIAVAVQRSYIMIIFIIILNVMRAKSV